MSTLDTERAARRRSGLLLGGIGLALVFGSGLALVFAPPSASLFLLAPMLLGIGLLVAGFVALPRTM